MKEIVYHFEKDPDYRIVATNAFVGKKTLKGDLFIDLCLERYQLPDEAVYVLTPEGKGQEISRDPEKEVVSCEAQVGFVLSTHQAKEMAYWILRELSDKTELT